MTEFTNDKYKINKYTPLYTVL